MTTHEAVLALVTGSGVLPELEMVAPSRRLGSPGILSGEELMATALAELAEADPEDHLLRLARREALLHRLAIDRQRRRRRSA